MKKITTFGCDIIPRHQSRPQRLSHGGLRAQAKAEDREAVLKSILPLQDRELRVWYANNKESVSLDFMLWMTGREAKANGDEKARLDALGSKLTALREGLDPETAAQLLSSLSPMGLLPETEATAVETQIQQRTEQLALRLAQTATSPQEMIAEQHRAGQFAEELRVRKSTSTTEVMGRADVKTEESLRGLDAATAADRILAVLLQIPDEQERAATVAEAFVPPEPEGSEGSPEEELLHTSPMRLLQAVKLAQRRLDAGGRPCQDLLLLPGTSALSDSEMREALSGIQAAIFAAWDPPRF